MCFTLQYDLMYELFPLSGYDRSINMCFTLQYDLMDELFPL